jgi:hypothetical protein
MLGIRPTRTFVSMSCATLVKIIPFPAASYGFGCTMEILISELLPCSRFAQQSQLLFQGESAPRLTDKDPNTIDCGLKLNLGTGPNMMQVSDSFWESHLKFAGHPAHIPYFSKARFLVDQHRDKGESRKGVKPS